MNKDTETGYLAYSHVLRILTQFNHWPTEAPESNPLKLPTLRTLRLASPVKGLELVNLPKLLTENEIAKSFRATSHTVAEARRVNRNTLQ